MVSPQSIRSNEQLMLRAANRLAQLQLDDSDNEDFTALRDSRNRGKKSGSLMTAAQKVKRTIDWPHLYVRRMVGDTRQPVNYNDLRVEEFVYGFLCMLDAPDCKWDYRMMTRILKHLMQDTIDFSWNNARAFYQSAGLEVEYGTTHWTDTEAIKDLRMAYSRTLFPQKKDARENARPAPQTAPAGTKMCTSFQKGECEHDKDHGQFTHACAYCHRTKTLLC